VKAAAFDYLRPQSVSQSLASLRNPEADYKIMAGSQSLGPMLNLRLARPSTVIDISGLSELRQVTQDGDTIRIGAGVTHAEIEDGVFAPLAGHPWQKVAGSIAYRSVRNRGTIGGSIAHADPAADWVLAASAMNAVIEIVAMPGQPADNSTASPVAARTVNMAQFMLAAYTTVLAPHDMIAAIRIPVMKPNASWGYFKFCRKVGEFAETSCAAYFDPDSRVANIVIGALDGAPKRLAKLSDLIARQGWSGNNGPTIQQHIMQSIQQAVPDRDPIDHSMMASTVARCLDRAFGMGEFARGSSHEDV
jgi:carbon-monoxide dehydrogenase medium subunit